MGAYATTTSTFKDGQDASLDHSTIENLQNCIASILVSFWGAQSNLVFKIKEIKSEDYLPLLAMPCTQFEKPRCHAYSRLLRKERLSM